MVKCIVVNFMAGAGKSDSAVGIAVDKVVIKLGRSGIAVRHYPGAHHRTGTAIEYLIEPDHISCSRPLQLDTAGVKVQLVGVADCIVLDYIVIRIGSLKPYPGSPCIVDVIVGDGVFNGPASAEDAGFKDRSYFVMGYGVVLATLDCDPGPIAEHTRVID